ncbi:MAG: hypothetical protein HKO92_12165 [Flavobacteriaceae bacterium]|nr:hypothetical protein [Flavobacteriaceae bacterium]
MTYQYDLKIEAIKHAARLARGVNLSKLHKICESQKSISTSKLQYLLEEIEQYNNETAILIKNLTQQF